VALGRLDNSRAEPDHGEAGAGANEGGGEADNGGERESCSLGGTGDDGDGGAFITKVDAFDLPPELRWHGQLKQSRHMRTEETMLTNTEQVSIVKRCDRDIRIMDDGGNGSGRGHRAGDINGEANQRDGFK